MKVIKANLPKELDEIELHIFADEHLGDPCCDISRLKERIDYVATHENAYAIMNGDILDFASRSSIGDVEARNLNIMDQLHAAVDLFKPIKKKIICVTNGNHENRGYRKEGFDISEVIAESLGLSEVYSPTTAFIFLSFGTQSKQHGGNGNLKRQYTLYVTHGSGGGRKEGAKAIRLADLATVCDADIYIHSHTHLPMVMKQGYFRTNVVNKSVTNVTKLFVNTSSNLDYGGYGEAQSFKPNSKDTPVIHLTASYPSMEARL